MVKRIMLVVMLVAVSSTLYAGMSQTTDKPNGITTATKSEKANFSTSWASGFLGVTGPAEIDGALRLDGATTINASLTMPNGILNQTDVFIDLAAADPDAYISSGTYPIGLTALVANGTSYTLALGDYSNSAAPRNVQVALVSTATAVTDQIDSTVTVVVAGILATGASDTETITGHETYYAGSKAWRSITSFTISGATMTFAAGYGSSNVAVNIGIGNVIGLSNSLYSVTATDVLVNEAGTRIEVSALTSMSTTYSTIDFATNGNGSNDYTVTYEADTRE